MRANCDPGRMLSLIHTSFETVEYHSLNMEMSQEFIENKHILI